MAGTLSGGSNTQNRKPLAVWQAGDFFRQIGLTKIRVIPVTKTFADGSEGKSQAIPCPEDTTIDVNGQTYEVGLVWLSSKLGDWDEDVLPELKNPDSDLRERLHVMLNADGFFHLFSREPVVEHDTDDLF